MNKWYVKVYRAGRFVYRLGFPEQGQAIRSAEKVSQWGYLCTVVPAEAAAMDYTNRCLLEM